MATGFNGIRREFAIVRDEAERLLSDARSIMMDTAMFGGPADQLPRKIGNLHLRAELIGRLSDVMTWLVLHEAALDGTVAGENADRYRLPESWDFVGEHQMADVAGQPRLHEVIDRSYLLFEHAAVLEGRLDEARH